MIEVIQGSGSYVYSNSDVSEMEHRASRCGCSTSCFAVSRGWGISDREVSALFRMSIAKRAVSNQWIRVAVIDCNPESLSILKRQLSYLPGVSLSLFSVESIALDDDPRGCCRASPRRHLHQALPISSCRSLKDSASKVGAGRSLARAPQTIVNISTLPEKCSLGIVCQSNKFAWLICEQLGLFAPIAQKSAHPLRDDSHRHGALPQALRRRHRGPDLTLFDTAVSGAARGLPREGRQDHPFEYTADRASLIHLEEHVDDILKQRGGL
jgi:hypothetical protein